MNVRRLTWVALLFGVAPLAFAIAATASTHPRPRDWATVLGTVTLGDGLLAALVVGSGRAGRRAVASTLAARPGCLFVYRAVDESVVPRRVRLLIAEESGLVLGNGRGAELRPAWHIPWAEVECAEVTSARFRTGVRPAIVLHLHSGGHKTLGLVDTYGLRNPAPYADAAARAINSHPGVAARHPK